MIPVSKIRDHLEIPDDLDDLKLEEIRDDAIGIIESDCGSIIQQRNFKQYFDGFSCPLDIRNTPITALTAIEYRDTNDVWQTVPVSTYVVSGEAFYEAGSENNGNDYFLYPEIRLQTNESWPSDISDKKDSVRITYAAGFIQKELPRSARRAIYLVCGELFENRERVGPLQLHEMPAYQMAIAPIKKCVVAY
jgi:hypothetical protein